MIPRNTPSPEHRTWQQQMREAIRSPGQLVEYLGLENDLTDAAAAGHQQFPVMVPQHYANLMKSGDQNDPLLAQVLPTAQEMNQVDGFSSDAVGDLQRMPMPGVIHKYHGRVLLIASAACAINCRYCFRRHFPYQQATAARENWRQAVDYLTSNVSVNEVILSGGDPLTLSTDKLMRLTEQLNAIGHIRRIRIHTRLPVVLPARVDQQLLSWISTLRQQVVIVIHVNHPAELDGQTSDALDELRKAGATLLNQSVLLKNVNDSAQILCELSERLFECGTLPYYLHCLDKVAGTAHFDLPAEQIETVVHEVRSRLAGFLVPRMVREVAGQPYKMPLL